MFVIQKIILYAHCIRIHQWIKNILVFIPLILSHSVDLTLTYKSILAFLAFNLIASSGYIINDILDRNNDRHHARKCKRPIASGNISITSATILACAFFILSMIFSNTINIMISTVMCLYLLITILYSFYLKKELVLDIVVLALLYSMRLVVGGIATGISLSVWLLAFSMFFFFSLASIKRYAEVVDVTKSENSKIIGRGYSVSDAFLLSAISLSSAYTAILVLALYLNSKEVVSLYKTPELLWPICLVLMYWMTRLVFITSRGQMHDDPIIYAFSDIKSYICAGFILLFFILSVLNNFVI